MSNPTPIDPLQPQAPVPAAGEPAPSNGAASFEIAVRDFWNKHSRTVLIVCVVVLAGIVAKGGWDAFRSSQEAALGREFQEANTTEKLKAFATAHAEHRLGGMAQLALADELYAAKKYAEAAPAYQRAVDTLKEGPFALRARLGAAVAKLMAGQADGLDKLKALANETNLADGIRAEAAYHVASAAAAEGRTEEATKFCDLAASIPNTAWTRRAMELRMLLPPPAEPAAPAVPAPTPAPKS